MCACVVATPHLRDASNPFTKKLMGVASPAKEFNRLAVSSVGPSDTRNVTFPGRVQNVPCRRKNAWTRVRMCQEGIKRANKLGGLTNVRGWHGPQSAGQFVQVSPVGDHVASHLPLPHTLDGAGDGSADGDGTGALELDADGAGGDDDDGVAPPLHTPYPIRQNGPQ